MDGRDFLNSIYPDKKIPKRQTEKTKMQALRRALSKSNVSILHKDTYESIPKNGGLWWQVFNTSPGSYQTKSGKNIQQLITKELESSPNTKKIHDKIGNNSLQILMLYKLVRTDKKRDLDNYTKNIIDSLRKGGLLDDDSHNRIKFIASKVEYLPVQDKSYYRAYEKVIVFVDFFNDASRVIKNFNSVFGK